MKLRLKSPTHMIIVFGILHGILSDIFFAVVATIIRPSSGAEIGPGIQLVISSTLVTAKGMQGAMTQMVPPFQQGHFMGINPMQSGSATPVGGIPSGLPNNQGPSNTNGTQMYPPGGEFILPQAEPMPPMPGLNPYQPRNPNATGMGIIPSSFSLPSVMPPPLPPGPPTHGQSTQ